MNTLRNDRGRARLHSFSLFSGLALLLTLGVPTFAQKAAPIDINLDPAATSIHWTLNTTIHTVHGTFKLKNGFFHIDPATGDASGQIVIDATSGESADSARDNRMQSVVLESPKYPTITFRPTHVVGKVDLAAPGPVTVDGFLNLHGQDHPMQITVNLHPQATAVALAAHFSVPYVAWGLKDPSTFIFRTDKEVILDVDATAIPTPGSSRATNSVARPILNPSEIHSAR
jgi:polyisoprenoid-binding protein YceI